MFLTQKNSIKKCLRCTVGGTKGQKATHENNILVDRKTESSIMMLQKRHKNRIGTKRLFIKPLTAEELKKQIDSPNDLAQKLGLTPSKSLIDNRTKEAISNDFLPYIADKSKDSDFYTMWIIIEKNKKAIIGGICFHGEPNNNGEVEIGYGIDSEYRNKGYMTETISGLIQWIREYKNVKAIVAETDNSNISSIKVLEKNDFKLIQQSVHSMIFKLDINRNKTRQEAII